jgi:hypothetical protein
MSDQIQSNIMREEFHSSPVFSRSASFATHHSGLFLPQRDPDKSVR